MKVKNLFQDDAGSANNSVASQNDLENGTFASGQFEIRRRDNPNKKVCFQ